MQIQQQPVDTWSDQEVSQLLSMVGQINTKITQIEQNTINIDETSLNIAIGAVAVTTAVYALVFLASIKLGYTISHYFLPSPKDIAG